MRRLALFALLLGGCFRSTGLCESDSDCPGQVCSKRTFRCAPAAGSPGDMGPKDMISADLGPGDLGPPQKLADWLPDLTGDGAPGKGLYGIGGRNATDIWAVGKDTENTDVQLVYHYDGTMWSPAKASGVFNTGLNAVWGRSTGNILAVGDLGEVVSYMNPTQFTEANPIATELYGIWSSADTDIWAAGAGGAYLHNDGSGWVQLNDQNDLTNYNGVWGSGPANVYLAGDGGVYQLNGQKKFSLVAGMNTQLNAIWGSGPSDIWAVGPSGTIMHFGGSRWGLVPSGTKNDLFGVWGSGPADVWAVGDKGTIVHWNGIYWASLTKPPTANSLVGVWGGGTGVVYAVSKRDHDDQDAVLIFKTGP